VKYYKVRSIGCKVAQYEAQQVRSLLERFGLVQAGPEQPDICVVNTCAVTATAAAKSKHAIHSLARTHPRAALVVLGCYASLAGRSIRQLPQLKLIADHNQGIMPALHRFLLRQRCGTRRPTANVGSPHSANTYTSYHIQTDCTGKVKDIFTEYPVNLFANRHRAILKVQDGCDANCTYCLIPRLRAHLTWANKPDVLDQARRFIDAGHREIILSGVFLGAYGKSTAKRSRLADQSQPLADLVESLLAVGGLGRLRLSSLEPGDLTPALVRIIADSDKLSSHLHLPLQSGSDRILKRMGRQYTARQYLGVIELANKHIADVAFTTDVLVGFPSETEDDFRDTVNIARNVGFAKIHIFPFSPREGTPAASWTGQMPAGSVIKSRLAELRGVEADLACKFRKRFLGREVRVLVEKVDLLDDNTVCVDKGNAESEKRGHCLGRADQYFPVRFPASVGLDNHLVRVRVDEVDPACQAVAGTLTGTIDP